MIDFLIIDDNTSLQNGIKLFAKYEEYIYHFCISGDLALDYLLECQTQPQKTPRIIFCDYNMPGLTGYDVSRSIKTAPEFAHISHIPIFGIGDFPDNKLEYLIGHKPKP
jgi:CheY-like chemotaxis protein